MNILARLLPYCLLMLTAAGDSPALAPTVDVAVTYRVVRAVAPGGPRKMTVQQTAGAMKTRIDSYIFADGKTPYEGMIADRKSDRMQVLAYARQAVMEAPADGFAIPGVTLAPDMLFKRGADRRTLDRLRHSHRCGAAHIQRNTGNRGHFGQLRTAAGLETDDPDAGRAVAA